MNRFLIILTLILSILLYGCNEEKMLNFNQSNTSDLLIQNITLTIESQLNCPEICNNNNTCDMGYCSNDTNYSCKFINKTPCCGNGILEQGEDYGSCKTDAKNYSFYVNINKNESNTDNTFEFFGDTYQFDITNVNNISRKSFDSHISLFITTNTEKFDEEFYALVMGWYYSKPFQLYNGVLVSIDDTYLDKDFVKLTLTYRDTYPVALSDYNLSILNLTICDEYTLNQSIKQILEIKRNKLPDSMIYGLSDTHFNLINLNTSENNFINLNDLDKENECKNLILKIGNHLYYQTNYYLERGFKLRDNHVEINKDRGEYSINTTLSSW